MKPLATTPCLISLLLAVLTPVVAAPEEEGKPSPASFQFASVEYFHRWSQEGQHEFTPKGQEDLQRWSDMMTLHHYHTARDGEALAAIANAVLERYRSFQAVILRTDSIPRTEDKPAEHLVVVAFPQPEFIEAAFARFKLVDGVGVSMIYSHRIYGKEAGDPMSAWLKQHGEATEKLLMAWEGLPLSRLEALK